MFAEPLRRRMGILVRENMPWWHSSVRGQVPHAFIKVLHQNIVMHY